MVKDEITYFFLSSDVDNTKLVNVKVLGDCNNKSYISNFVTISLMVRMRTTVHQVTLFLNAKNIRS